MIRIDLLPNEFRRAERTAPAQFFATVGLVALFCSAAAGSAWGWFGVVGGAKADVEMAQDVLDGKTPQVRYADQLEKDIGVTFTQADQDRHHEAFRAELPGLLGARGRLVVARLGDEPVGVGTLKPVDDTTAEIKRMYVRPSAQGHGVGRALLTRLVDGQWSTVRLQP